MAGVPFIEGLNCTQRWIRSSRTWMVALGLLLMPVPSALAFTCSNLGDETGVRFRGEDDDSFRIRADGEGQTLSFRVLAEGRLSSPIVAGSKIRLKLESGEEVILNVQADGLPEEKQELTMWRLKAPVDDAVLAKLAKSRMSSVTFPLADGERTVDEYELYEFWHDANVLRAVARCRRSIQAR